MGGDCSILKSCNVSRHHHTHSLAHSTRLCRFRAVRYRIARGADCRFVQYSRTSIQHIFQVSVKSIGACGDEKLSCNRSQAS